jgi:hypothetical protein
MYKVIYAYVLCPVLISCIVATSEKCEKTLCTFHDNRGCNSPLRTKINLAGHFLK